MTQANDPRCADCGRPVARMLHQAGACPVRGQLNCVSAQLATAEQARGEAEARVKEVEDTFEAYEDELDRLHGIIATDQAALTAAQQRIADAREHAEWLRRNIKFPTDGELVRRVLALWSLLSEPPAAQADSVCEHLVNRAATSCAECDDPRPSAYPPPPAQAALDEKDLVVQDFLDGPTLTVRITHKPSGLFGQCGEHKSSIKNKAEALRMLQERLTGYGWTPAAQADSVGAGEPRCKQFIEECQADCVLPLHHGGLHSAAQPGACYCSDGGPGSYDGPLRDCPVHGDGALPPRPVTR